MTISVIPAVLAIAAFVGLVCSVNTDNLLGSLGFGLAVLALMRCHQQDLSDTTKDAMMDEARTVLLRAQAHINKINADLQALKDARKDDDA